MASVRIHVFCGGGTGSRLIQLLSERGHQVSVGILAPGDADLEVVDKLSLVCVRTSLPRQPPEPSTLKEARALLATSEVLAVTPFAVGRANVANLELAEEFSRSRPLLHLEGLPITDRDYTEGRATQLYNLLQARATAKGRTPSELLLAWEQISPG